MKALSLLSIFRQLGGDIGHLLRRVTRWSTFFALLAVSARNAAAQSYAPSAGRGLSAPVDEAKLRGLTVADFPAEDADVFPDLDGIAPGPDGIHRRLVLKGDEIKGRNTWIMWCGGNEAFWDWMARDSYGLMDLLKVVDSRNRDSRFKAAGLINQPGMKQAEKADEYGLWLDVPGPGGTEAGQVDPAIYGRPSGVVGLRVFPNPEFKGEAVRKWDAQRFYQDPEYYKDPNLIRPYRVGMSCAFCHVGPHPLYPPQDPEHPEWKNLSSTIGAQYFRTSAVFGNLLPRDSFIYWLLESQQPGTIDTSLVATDHINNPNTMNAVFDVPARLERALANEPEYQGAAGKPLPHKPPESARSDPRAAPRVLLDGSDSVGVWGALARVYLNIGTYHQQWLECVNPVVGFRKQKPFRIKDCEEGSVYWQANRNRVPYLAAFFTHKDATAPMKFDDARRVYDRSHPKVEPSAAPGTQETADQIEKEAQRSLADGETLRRGARIFAENCAMCHSSKQETITDTGRDRYSLTWSSTDEFTKWKSGLDGLAHAAWMRTEMGVEDPAGFRDKLAIFLKKNYLSTEIRQPVSLIGTNAARACATNALEGHVWEDFSSKTYRNLPAVGDVEVWNPLVGDKGAYEKFAMRGGGRGYYRPPSLISIWATAPYLHNNSVGLFNNDPSFEGRVAAYYDGMSKLLNSKCRLDAERSNGDPGWVYRTPQETWIRVSRNYLPQAASGLLADMPESLSWLRYVFRWPWLPGLVLFFAAGLLFRFSSRLRRYFAMVTLTAGVAALLAGFFISGQIKDIEIGPIPKGTPVNLLANFDPGPLVDPDSYSEAEKKRASDALQALWTIVKAAKLHGADSEESNRAIRNAGPALNAASQCPDYIMDRGHAFADHLDKAQRKDLIEFLKLL